MLALPSSANNNRTARGFSVVELMVAVTLSLILLGGVVTLFASSRKSYESNDHLARIQETGRFALDQIVRDIRSAGYLGCAKQAPFKNTLKTATNTLLWDLANPAQGFQSTGTAWSPTLDSTLVPSAAAINSDVLVLRAPDPDAQTRRVSAIMGSTSADVTITPATPAYIAGDTVMITDCNATSTLEVTGYAAGVISHKQDIAQPGSAGAVASSANSTEDLGYAFQEGAQVIPVRTVIYYVRQSTDPANGNSLWRRLGRNAPEELVEGVDSLQIRFGVDTNADRIVDTYTTANLVTDWGNVISVQVGLLVRSLEQYGNNPDIEHDVLGVLIPAASDNRERLVFTSTAALRNKAL
ncbi:MAG TPA: PilW family protein [Steroidobacteraceae bacterium]|jgi:type IV pilus assembly protein PilW